MLTNYLDGTDMANIRTQPSDYVKFILRSEISEKLVLNYEPVGWSSDYLEYIRHKEYHGIMIQFTGELSFYKEAHNYLENDYQALGVNSNLTLEKYELIEVGGEIRWGLVYEGIVDYTTRSIDGHAFKVKFNSNLLEEIIKTRENDDFDLERLSSIDEKAIPSLVPDKVNLTGIPLSENNKLTLKTDTTINDGTINNGNDYESDYARGFDTYQKVVFRGGNKYGGIDWINTPILELAVDGNNRVSSPDSSLYSSDEASKMFYVDTAQPNPNDPLNTELVFTYSLDADIKTVSYKGSDSRHELTVSVAIVRYARNADTQEYDFVEIVNLKTIKANRNNYQRVTVAGEYTASNMKLNEGLALGFIAQNKKYNFSSIEIRTEAKVYDWTINVTLNTHAPATTDHKFLFVEDCLKRFMTILTGEQDRSLTRTFAKPYNEHGLSEGLYGAVGITYGLWIRKFTEEHKLYKSMKLSLGDLLESLNAVFNTGVGVEAIDGKQKLVVEELDFFYQDQVKIKLPNQISNVRRKTLKEDIFSTIEIGYNKGGNYSDTLGLDEPNIKTNRITPIRKNKVIYRKLSDIRADDVGLELIRRQPASVDQKKDTAQDDHLWFLDLKKDDTTDAWVQKTWEDRMSSRAENLSYGEYFKSFLFTPLRMLLRHGWVIRTGLNQKINLDKTIAHVGSDGNQTLRTRFIGENRFYGEDEDIPVKELDQPKTEPESVDFTHPISDELLRELISKSEVEYKGNKVSIPNYYFKIEYVNEHAQVERGYITAIKPKDNRIEVIKCNEKILL